MSNVRRALLSVSDKHGLVPFARELSAAGVELVSTGGTRRALAEAGIAALEVAAKTGFPEIMDGRVKTLHPKIHGGLLGRRGTDDAVMAEHGIEPIDLLVVNLYPFEETIARDGASFEECVENIDIGGPAMIRAAAKNHESVAVVVDPEDYDEVLQALRAGALDLAFKRRLAARAFAHTASYDAAIAEWLGRRAQDPEPFREHYAWSGTLAAKLRYGENPHQQAALYRDRLPARGSLALARQLQGKPLSYNNLADSDAALECARQFDAPACVIVKHANPCGVATADSLLAAYELAWETDRTSAFGGIIACNCPLDAATAGAIVERQFVEVIVAPAVDDEARAVLADKPNVRVLETGTPANDDAGVRFLRVSGGMLVQTADDGRLDRTALRTVTTRTPDERQLADMLFAWRVAKFVKSNAIVFASGGRTLGVGAGQMSRVDSTRIAAMKAADAGLPLAGAVMASDAFFPFRDGLDRAAEHGIAAVIQPGGSQRDEEVIAAADEHGLAMVFTGMRHFRH